MTAQIGHTLAHGDRTVKILNVPVPFPLIGTSQLATELNVPAKENQQTSTIGAGLLTFHR